MLYSQLFAAAPIKSKTNKKMLFSFWLLILNMQKSPYKQQCVCAGILYMARTVTMSRSCVDIRQNQDIFAFQRLLDSTRDTTVPENQRAGEVEAYRNMVQAADTVVQQLYCKTAQFPVVHVKGSQTRLHELRRVHVIHTDNRHILRYPVQCPGTAPAAPANYAGTWRGRRQ